MRYEKKYRILFSTFEEVLTVLKHHPLGFKSAYGDRWINSIYFDTFQLSAFNENQNGISKRKKKRIRWYGSEEFAQKPKLEAKMRENQLGTKRYLDVPEFSPRIPSDVKRAMKACDLYNEVLPTSLIRYQRTYLISYNQKLRATIDRDLQYYAFDAYQIRNKAYQDPALVLELKCAKEDFELLKTASQYIPYRMSKNSKYVSGVISGYK